MQKLKRNNYEKVMDLNGIDTLSGYIPQKVSIEDLKKVKENVRQCNHRPIEERTYLLINPNKSHEKEEKLITSYSEFVSKMDYIIKSIGADPNDLDIIRADFCFNSRDESTFEDYQKLHRLIISCLADTYKFRNCYVSCDLWDYDRLSIAIKKDDYLTYTLSKPARTYNGKKVRDANGNIKTQQKCNSAQNMVARMFVYNPYPRMQYAIEDLQAHHKDKNRQNNYYKNLMWLSTEDHGFVHRIKRIAIYNSDTCKYRCNNDIESILKKIRMNIFEFRKTVKLMDREKMTVKDGQWIVYLINGVYVALEYYSKK